MPWRYDIDEETFINLETGDVLTVDEAEDLVDDLIERYQDEADDLINNLDVEDPGVAEFESGLSELIRQLFIVLAILGGGMVIFNFLQRQVEIAIQRQFRFLARFADQLYEGVVPIGSARMRARMYLNSARSAYWMTREEVERRRGMTMEIWEVIGDEFTCEACMEAAMMGPQPIGTFGQPGSGIVVRVPMTFCRGLTSCRCRKRFT